MTIKKIVTKKVVSKKSLPKAQKGKQVSGMYDFQNIYTGPDSTSPGVLKAQADKKKADANLSAYKKKIEAEKQNAIKKAKQPKMANGGAVKCWPGYEKQGSKVGQSGKTVNNCVKKAKDGGKFSYARELASLKGRIKKTMKDGGSTPAWTRKEGKNPSGGLNAKGRASYNAANPGSNLKAPQPEGGSRKKSFCARMSGVKGPMKKPNGEPTRKALALRKWKC